MLLLSLMKNILPRKKYHEKLLLLVEIKILPEYELIIFVQAHVNALQVNY